ncbi:MAG: hypothetical protein IT462_09545 [Planctomycetes bacterium]|nr:hypothetical protein [Planctomycetota bacterium]
MRGKWPFAALAAFVVVSAAVAAAYFFLVPRPAARPTIAEAEPCAPTPAAPAPELAKPARPPVRPTPTLPAETEAKPQAPDFTRALDLVTEAMELQIKVCSYTSSLQSEAAELQWLRESGDANEKDLDEETRRIQKAHAALVADQKKVKSLCGQGRDALLAADKPDLSADLNSTAGLCDGALALLQARVPDYGDLTQQIQSGVVDRLQAVVATLQTLVPKAEPSVIKPDAPPVEIKNGDNVTLGSGQTLRVTKDLTLSSLYVPQGANVRMGAATLTVTGDFVNDGTFEGDEGTLVFSGGAQRLSGNANARQIRMTGGEKHVVAGSRFVTTQGDDSEKDDPALFIDAGTTLVIDKDAEWNTGNPFGIRVAGTLIIDGGTFNCGFTNGQGHGKNRSWMPGSKLIIRDGKFTGAGDAEFTGASVYVQGGELRITDDIWASGDLLELSGGVMSNTSSGGMFALNGIVRFMGGTLEANQRGDRGLRICVSADVQGTQGEVVIAGGDVAGPQGGINLQTSASLPNLVVNRSTVLSVAEGVNDPTLLVHGEVQIAKGKKFCAQGGRVIGSIAEGEEFGKFEP